MIRVLIVDDRPDSRYLLRALLQGHGFAVDEACNGVEALIKGRQVAPDLIVSDLLMPVMDGYTLLRQWKADEQLQAIPFIVYTATYTELQDEKLARDLHADAFIIKPAEPEALMAQVRAVMEQARRDELATAPPQQTNEPVVLRQYNEVLAHKLEEKCRGLEAAVNELHQLNAELEQRVRERTAELQVRNRELTEALENVKELAGLLPICSYCKKIRDGDQYWHQVESYIAKHSRAQFSHGICPDCFEQRVKPELKELGITNAKWPGQQNAGP